MAGNLESQLAAVKDILNFQVIVSEISFFHFMRQDRLKLKVTVLYYTRTTVDNPVYCVFFFQKLHQQGQ